VERPSAKASERPSILYLRESVRKGGAAGCGLSPARPTAWHRTQFVVSNDSPRAAGVAASSAKTGKRREHCEQGNEIVRDLPAHG